MSSHSDKKQVTLSTLKKMKEHGEKFTCLTSYESTMTSKICEAGVDVVLVGDSLGMVIQGHDSTLPVTMDQLGATDSGEYGTFVRLTRLRYSQTQACIVIMHRMNLGLAIRVLLVQVERWPVA